MSIDVEARFCGARATEDSTWICVLPPHAGVTLQHHYWHPDTVRLLRARLVPAEDEGRLLDSVMARVQLRLLAGDTDATYSPTEVAELVASAIDEQRGAP